MAKHVGAKAAAAAKDEKKAKQDSQKNAQADTHGTKEEKERERRLTKRAPAIQSTVILASSG